MAWPFREGYRQVMGSMLDGTAHRDLLTAMNAGQRATQQQQPYPPYPMNPYFPVPQGQGPEEEEKDKRGSIFNLGGGNKNGQPQQKPLTRSKRS